MKKHTKQFFLYKHRLQVGYALLAIVFVVLLCFLPNLAPNGLSQTEMDSVVASSTLEGNILETGDTINLPYRILQKASLHFFGLNYFSIRLPSIIIAVAAGFFIILLLNRWFKNDVAIITSILTTLSTAFLFLAGNGTPLIMYVFWLALILWLGSKIVGNDNVNPLLTISFFLCIALSSYTPHLLYVSFAIAIAGIMHPHLRFALKQLNFWQLILCFSIFILTIAPLVISCFTHSENIQNLLGMSSTSTGGFISNISKAFVPFFSFSLVNDSIYLSPLFGLATVALVVIGVLASIGKLFTSRNTIVSLLIIYSIVIAGLNSNVAISIVIPIAILSAAGLESIISKWYSLFPENPYAHLIGIIPMVTIIVMIIGTGLSHYVFGYHYAPRVANNFNTDLKIIEENVKGMPLLVDDETVNKDFYKLTKTHNNRALISSIDEAEGDFATFNKIIDDKFTLKRIITSPKSRNSDRLYIYSKVTDNKGE